MKTITAIAFALSLGLIAGSVSAHEASQPEDSAFPLYESING